MADEETTIPAVLRKRISDNLRTARESAGLSQPDVAARMVENGFRYSQQALARVEAGSRKVDGAELVTLARIYGVNETHLLRPQGLALNAWSILNSLRQVRDVHRQLKRERRRLSNLRSELARLIEDAEQKGLADDLEWEMSLGRRALRDTEDACLHRQTGS